MKQANPSLAKWLPPLFQGWPRNIIWAIDTATKINSELALKTENTLTFHISVSNK